MNATFEDCFVLNSCIKRYSNNWRRIFKEYQRLRKVNTDTLANLSKENFYELRDGVQSLYLVAKKEVDITLNKFFPVWLPLYTLISHTTIPYADAVRRAQIQDRIGKWMGVGLLIRMKVFNLWLRSLFNSL